MHLYEFISLFVPKLVAMVTPLCTLCTGVSEVNSPNAQTQSVSQTLHGYVAYIWSFGHFLWLFRPILPKIWLSWQRPSDLCNQKCLHWIGQPRKRPHISSHILVIYHTNAYVFTVYSYFSPKIGFHSNLPLSVVYGSVTDQFPDSGNPVSKSNSARIRCIQLKL